MQTKVYVPIVVFVNTRGVVKMNMNARINIEKYINHIAMIMVCILGVPKKEKGAEMQHGKKKGAYKHLGEL